MALLRKYIWLLVILGMIFVSVVISLIFFLINKCISRQGKHRISNLHKRSDFNISSNKYQETTLKADVPPLPPRTQFLTAEAQSYENLAEAPEYEQSTPDYVQSTPDYVQSMPDYVQSTPDYVQSTPDYVQSMPDYEQNIADYEQSTPDDVQSMQDYEQIADVQSLDEQPDYVKVDEEEILPPPPPCEDPAEDNSSTEDYDDIGGENENEAEEDYDDVG
ncbi:DNA-directed RNA polymerase II subunit RPB1-like [Micropterus salmoides]|uniref:DNA-directed RNA polymerase II subunit RPB1-like n=1 Tax=Micropterus salmoides TaxID=27706 RepID=UPI0018EDDB6B|nr:DNA-directed RNA polymerase II subunit RPB1-like [Micropterus salmoides]XP_038565293.1 DNA-directed RNA polymerase II subunit RPB1-like [Micropterus salmoides]